MRRTIKKWTYDIVFVDTSRDISDPLLKGFAQNLAEFWFYRFKDSANIDRVMVVPDHDSALRLVRHSDAQFVVISEIGNAFHHRNPLNFLDALDLALGKDVFVMGHILDRGGRYYEVHGQCYVVNVPMFKSILTPPTWHGEPGLKRRMLRSPDNYHDDYTPLWVRLGEGMVDVPYPAPGADLVATGLRVQPFPQEVRDSRVFLYPKKPSYRGNLPQVLSRSGPNRHRHYAFSYEPIPFGLDELPPLDYIACPCNGLNLFRYLDITGFNDGMTIQLYDINPTSLEIYQRIMTDWNGMDYDSLFDGKRAVVRNLHQDDYWAKFMTAFGGPAEWLRFLARVRRQNVSIELVDLLDVTGNLQWDVTGNALFVASNIYDFSETGLFYDTEYRVRAYQRLLDSLPGDTWVHTIFPLRESRTISRVRDERLEPIERFPWRKYEV